MFSHIAKLFGTRSRPILRTDGQSRSRLQMEQLEGRVLLSAVGDFNGDGYKDLAIGVPQESAELAGYHDGAGLVRIIYGGGGQTGVDPGQTGNRRQAGDR